MEEEASVVHKELVHSIYSRNPGAVVGAEKEAESVDTMRDLVASVDEEIATSVKQYYLWWRIWNRLTISATAASILFRFIASVVAVTKAIEKPYLAAIVAGVPAMILSLSQTMKFSERADWFWNLVVQYQSLQRALERKDVSHADASRKCGDYLHRELL